jgi:hypothetical protein
MSYEINGIGVGKEPYSITRDSAYLEMFDKLGNSPDNIKTITNFISSDLCDQIVSNLISSTSSSEQWRDTVYRDNGVLLSPLGKMIQDQIELSFQTSVEMVQQPFVIKWSKGQSMGLHVDDLGIETYHITGLIYLNDDYIGGEISFPTHDITIKPNKGELVLFPGNLHYAHEVREVISGDRYTIPVWCKFINQ